MTSEQLSTVEGIVVTLANGAAYLYPPAAPLVTAIRMLLEAAEEHGILPTEVPSEQLAAIAAGMAAARASAITSDRARRK